MSAIDPSEARFRDRLVKHMTQRPKQPKPAEPQSPRLLAEITDGIREQDAKHRERRDARGAFNAMRGSELAQALTIDLTADATEVDGDRDLFGGAMMERASRHWRLSGNLKGHAREKAERIAARNDAARVAAAEELELRAQTQAAEQMVEEYPDMDPETAAWLAGKGDDDDAPLAA